MRARGLAIGATVVVLLVGGAVVVDRVAASRAEAVAAHELTANGVAGQPEVQIGGFPFLTQLLSGKLTDVAVRADAMTLDGVELTDVDVDAGGVTTAAPYTVDDVRFTGTLSATTLAELVATRSDLALDLTIDGDQLTAATTLLGLAVTATLEPRVADGEIRVGVSTVALGGFAVDVADLPGVLARQLSDLAVPIEGLPDGLELSGVVVRDGSLRITATGQDVVLSANALG